MKTTNYLCNQLIGLIVCITQLMLGVASIGTGTKRFISFFIALKMGWLSLSETASLFQNIYFLPNSGGHTNPAHLPLYVQLIPKNVFRFGRCIAAMPKGNSQQRSVLAFPSLAQYYICNWGLPVIFPVVYRLQLSGRLLSQIDLGYSSAFEPNKYYNCNQTEIAHSGGDGQYQSKTLTDCYCASG
ncbi:hypothetical protein [Spirosoma foliorum]|uniref:hypothetical protein n=1 Tax=Spirosoma foliorum TaxID=2710596 RepID=UPI001F0A0AD2|nr:hypothetical protein [Spirosoma foliorum]